MNIVKILILQDCVAFGLELRVREVVQGNGRGENGSSQLVGDAALAVNNFPGSFFRLDERGVLASIRTLAGCRGTPQSVPLRDTPKCTTPGLG
jgi:hypothetical protein